MTTQIKLGRIQAAVILIAMALIAMILIFTSAGGLAGGSQSTSTDSENFSQSDDHSHVGPPIEFQQLRGVGFIKAPAALDSAIQSAPFRVDIPNQIPEGIDLWRTDLYIDDAGKGNLELYWTTAPRADRSPLPAFRISWTNAGTEADVEAQLPPVVDRTTFTANGMEWQVYKITWRDFDMYQARTLTPDGVVISSDIRVIDLTDDEALEQLRTSLDSMTP